MIDIRPATLHDITFVLGNLNKMDDREISCVLPDSMTLTAAGYHLLMGGDAYVALLDDKPIACFGTSPMTPVCVSAWMFGTRKVRRAAPAITRYFRDVIGPRLAADGIRTVEVRTWTEHTEAHRWMDRWGAVRQDPPFVYGKNGEKFVIYRWTDEVFAARSWDGDRPC